MPARSHAVRSGGPRTATFWGHPVVSVVAVLALALAAAMLTVAAPARADAPPGSQAELIFAQDPDYQTPVQSGTFNTELFSVPRSGDYTPAGNGCGAGQDTAFAFVAASDDPSQLGSAERPRVTTGATVASLFTWPATDEPGNADGFAYQMAPGSLIGQASDLVRLDRRWPAGTALSMVAVCFIGRSSDPTKQVVAAGSDGYALTSWLQFTTIASTSNPAQTSVGFTLGALRIQPTVGLTGAPSGTQEKLTATLSDDSGTRLTDASGRVDFYAGTGSSRKIATSSPVDSTGASSVLVDIPPAGTQVVYEAVYVPDAVAARTYGSATSHRFAVVGPSVRLAPTITVTASPRTYGTASSASVQVRRDGAPASGDVAFLLDGRPLAHGILSAGRARVELAPDTPAGDHEISVSYAGSGTTEPGSARTTLTVPRAESTMTVVVRKAKKHAGGRSADSARVHHRRHPKKVKLVVSVVGPTPALQPTGDVTAVLHGKTLVTSSLSASGAAVLTLPLLPKKSKHKVDVVVTFAGNGNFAGATQTLHLRLPGKPHD